MKLLSGRLVSCIVKVQVVLVGKLKGVSEQVSVGLRNSHTNTTFVGVCSAGPVLSSKERSLTEPVNGMRMMLSIEYISQFTICRVVSYS